MVIKNTIKIIIDSEISKIGEMTYADVIRVANQKREARCGSGYKYPCARLDPVSLVPLFKRTTSSTTVELTTFPTGNLLNSLQVVCMTETC